jgi:hypothetical protein
MWQDIVVANVGYNWDYEVVVRIAIFLISIVLAKDLEHLLHHELVELSHLLCCSWVFLVIVVTRRVSSPDDKVDLVPQLFPKPFYCLVD